jgi:HK97 family phage portal protein
MAWWWPWRRVEERQQYTLEQLLAETGAPTAAGEPVTTDTAMRLSTVWRCVTLLSDSVSTLPLHVRRGDDPEPIPTPPLLQRPSADFEELSDWLWAVMASLLLRGNTFGLITARAGAGLLPAQVDLVHPDHMAVTLDPEDGRVVYRLGGETLDPSAVWHVKAYPFPAAPRMPPLGLSPIAHARESIGLGLAAEKYAAEFFGDAAIPSGVLTTPEQINQEVANELKARWKHRFQGKREIAVLGAGAKFQAITIAPEEAQFIETQKANTATIAKFFGLDPRMVGGETGGHDDYSSPEQRSTDFLTYSLRPWLYRVERAVSRLLPRNQNAKFNAGGFARATLLDRYQAHKLGIEAGWLLPSEARELEDLPPIPGIDDRPTPQGGAVA